MKQLLLGLVLLLTTIQIHAQSHKWEIGLLMGATTYQGDLVEPNLYDFKELNFAYGGFLKWAISDRVSLRGNLLRGKITGDDINSDARADRSFNFSAPLTEFSAQMEYEFFGHRRTAEYGMHQKVVSPYVFLGLGMTIFDPEINFGSNANSSQIREDINAGPHCTRAAVPIGLGVKADLSENWVIGAEWGARYVFSDRIDGVNASGNPDKNDWYAFAGLNIGYRFSPKTKEKEEEEQAKEN